MKKIKNFLHEIKNGEKMKDFLPSTTLYNMLHHFSKKNAKGIAIFEDCLYKISDMKWLNFDDYKEDNPANQVLLHGAMYKALLDIYKKYLGFNLDDPFFNQYPSVKPIALSWDEYIKLPKKYRGIWEQTDEGYVLNITKQPMVIIVIKKQKNRLKQLLKRADILLPVIYKEKTPDIDFGGKLQLFETPSKTAVFPNSISAKCINDEQLNTIKEMYDIFIEISKITLPVRTLVSVQQTSGAPQIFAEYVKEQKRKNIFINTKEQINAAKTQEQIELQKVKQKYEQNAKNIKEEYRKLHTEMLNALKQQTDVKIK